MLFACISFSFLIYTVVDRSQSGVVFALAWFVVSDSFYANIESDLTPNGMAALGWNFIMANTRTNFLLDAGANPTAAGYNLATSVTWLYIDTALYLLLAWYFILLTHTPYLMYWSTSQVHR
jgi:hypothetical protein